MMYLFFQTWGWIIAAFILGLLVGWWLCGRCRCSNKEVAVADDSTAEVATASVVSASQAGDVEVAAEPEPVANLVSDVEDIQVDDSWQPSGFSERPADADELKRIKGIGPVIEKTLNGLGIYQFKQIAEFSRDNIAWVDKYIAFPGRIDREEWVSQAKELAEGKETEFSKRVDKGEMDY